MFRKLGKKFIKHLNEMDNKTFYSLMGIFLIVIWGCIIWGIKSIMTMF